MDISCTYTVFTFLHVFSFLEFRLSFATKLSISLVQLFLRVHELPVLSGFSFFFFFPGSVSLFPSSLFPLNPFYDRENSDACLMQTSKER